jgi:outer membrane biogenesis lipoprotein LolB
MPTTFKCLLYLTAASVFLFACMFFVEKPAAQQHEAHQQIQGWEKEGMVELSMPAEPSAFMPK